MLMFHSTGLNTPLPHDMFYLCFKELEGTQPLFNLILSIKEIQFVP